MGIFSFIKNAGEKLFGSKAQAAEKATDAGSMKGVVEYVGKMGFKVKDLDVSFDPATATATVRGEAPDMETKEKVVLCVGNVDGVEKVNDEMTCAAAPAASAATSAAESQFYQVKSGDTLSKISKEVYGDANKYNAIFEANKPMLSHPDKIYPGQTLRIPKL